MSKPIKTIHLLILDPSSNEAEQSINVLRNTGYAVRATQILSDEELQAALERQQWDLMLGKAHSQSLSVLEAVRIIKANDRDIPFITLSQALTPKEQVEGYSAGMAALIPDNEPQLLLLTVERELGHLEERRRRRRAESLLNEAEKRCNLLLDSSRDAIAYIHDGMHIYANKSYVELFGYEGMDELECMPIMDMLASDAHESFKDFLRNREQSELDPEFSFTGVKADGELFDAYLSLSDATYDGELCTQILIRTATADSRELEAKLRELASKEPVTGLFSRQRFIELLSDAIAAAVGGGKSSNILFVELDRFAALKDKFGITETDNLLKEAAQLLSGYLPKDTVAARIGDDLFGLVVPLVNPADAKNLAETLCAQFREQMFELAGQTETLTLSIGISPIGENAPNAEEIMSRAQTACIRARSRGGNTVKIYEPAVDSAGGGDSHLVEKIQEALENNTLSLTYQPIVRLQGDDAEFYDVTLHMRDESGNAIAPEQFFPVANQAGLAGKLDRWTLGNAAKALAAQRAAGKDAIRLFVRLSATSLTDETLLTFIGKTLSGLKLPPDAVVFAIHEADAAVYLKRAIALTEKLVQLGGAVCLAGYGASLNPMSVLKHLPAQYLKLEGSLSQELLSNKETQERAKELLDEAHKLGKQSIVPSVEDASSLALLWPWGVHYIQGYYLSGPLHSMSYDFSLAEF